VAPDFEHTKPEPDAALLFVHRTLPGAEIYWVNNRKPRREILDATFRIAGKVPELWYPETGIIEPASYRIERGRTVVPLRLEAGDAVFVVFRKAATSPSRQLPVAAATIVATLEGPWQVAFQPDRGAPATATLPSLASWTAGAPGIKYFSGTATYRQDVDAPASWFVRGGRVWLDLGEVRNVAEVRVNGARFQVLWRPPFRVNVTSALKPGRNQLEIAVTNLWVNRIIGDLQPGADRKFTHTPIPFYRADSPLLPSGLIGPVTVANERVQ
jgi:hypothetical protein